MKNEELLNDYLALLKVIPIAVLKQESTYVMIQITCI